MASNEMRSQMEISHLNIVGYLEKPITFSELTRIVKSYYDLDKSGNAIMLSAKNKLCRFATLNRFKARILKQTT